MTAPILFLHPSDEAYGADRIALAVIVGLRSRGWPVHVALPSDTSPGWLSSQLAAQGVPVERLPLAPARRRYLRLGGIGRYFLDLLRARQMVRRRARDLDIGLVYVNTSALLVGALLGRPNGAALVWHVHEIVVSPIGLARLFRLLPGLTADRVIVVSAAVARHLDYPRSRANIHVVHNGIPERQATPVQEAQRQVVAYVGRLNRWKGYEIFVDAAREVGRRYEEATFVVAGDAAEGDEWRVADLHARVAATGLAGQFELPGFVDDVPALLDRATIIVVPSTWPDPFPTVVLEAMRAGRAVVATAHGGSVEMIEDGISGLLIPPNDVPALAQAVGRLLGDPTLTEELAAAARGRFIDHFSEPAFLDQVERLCAEAVRR